MKKIFLVFLVTVLLCAGSVFAVPSLELNVNSAQNEINEETKQITIKISLGDITEIAEAKPMGYEAILEYDENIFENVTVKGLNDWTASYSEATKRIIGDTDVGKENTEITEITLQLRDDYDLSENDEIIVKLNDILISDDDLFELTFNNKSVSFKVIKSQEENNNEEKPTDGETEDNNTKNEIDNNETTNNINTNKTDNTTTSERKLPKTGLGSIIIGIIVFSIFAVIFIIKYKNIELK